MSAREEAGPKRIWLQSAEDSEAYGEPRLWCEDKVWPDDEEDHEPTEYIRLDLHEAALLAERKRAEDSMRERAALYVETYDGPALADGIRALPEDAT